MLKMLWQSYTQSVTNMENIQFHPRCRLGFYDQSLKQLNDRDALIDSLEELTDLCEERRKIALISAGFEYNRHSQKVCELSGGERSRLLMLGLSLAEYHLLMLDEPTNHLDIDGKDQLSDTLNQFEGGVLLVTHDRELIEKSCNRYWLIKDGELTEWHDLEKLYGEIDSETKAHNREFTGIELLESESTDNGSSPSPSLNLNQASDSLESEEAILERLYQLETLIEDDKQRKPKHQKPKMQQQWQQELEQITLQLNL